MLEMVLRPQRLMEVAHAGREGLLGHLGITGEREGEGEDGIAVIIYYMFATLAHEIALYK